MDENPTLEEQREIVAAHVAEVEEDLAHARERLRRIEREIAHRDLQNPKAG